MNTRPFNLALETSSRSGSVTLGRGDEILTSRSLPEQVRHRVDLLPTIDGVCRERAVKPGDIGEVYVSVGPGSFTGLRIAIATAKMLARAVSVRLVAVPTVEAVAKNIPLDRVEAQSLAVCLNMKKQSVYTGLFGRGSEGWVLTEPARVTTIDEMISQHTGTLAILGDPLPGFESRAGLTVLDKTLAQPTSEQAWCVGRAMAKRGEFVDEPNLLPIYAREPEAVTLWEALKRKREQERALRA